MTYKKPAPDDIDQPTFEKQPPDVYAECRKVLSQHNTNNKPWPNMLDRNYEVAARWWVDEMQEPYNDATERPKLIATFGGNKDGQRWISPYQDRVANNLRAFLQMPESRQRFVAAAREDGFWWRGEDEDVLFTDSKGVTGKHWLFALVVEQYELQKKMGKAKYAEMARKRMHAVMGKACSWPT